MGCTSEKAIRPLHKWPLFYQLMMMENRQVESAIKRKWIIWFLKRKRVWPILCYWAKFPLSIPMNWMGVWDMGVICGTFWTPLYRLRRVRWTQAKLYVVYLLQFMVNCWTFLWFCFLCELLPWNNEYLKNK